MALATRTKRALQALIAAYVLLVLVLSILGYAGRKPHPDRDKTVEALMAVRQTYKPAMPERDVKEMYDRFFAEKGAVFGLNYTTIMQIVNFAVLLAILYLLLWQPMIAFLDARRQGIRQEMDSARQTHAEAKGVLSEYETKLAGARAERQSLIDDGRSEGRREREAIVAQARSQAERILDNARQETAAEVEHARSALRSEVAGLSVQVAQRILEREIKSADHEAMIDDLVKDIESADLST